MYIYCIYIYIHVFMQKYRSWIYNISSSYNHYLMILGLWNQICAPCYWTFAASGLAQCWQCRRDDFLTWHRVRVAGCGSIFGQFPWFTIKFPVFSRPWIGIQWPTSRPSGHVSMLFFMLILWRYISMSTKSSLVTEKSRLLLDYPCFFGCFLNFEC